jgi:5-methyltetrahydrofolate--homocysteine methyltransferase
MSIFDERILIFDGACGTSIQRMNLPADAWAGCEGCNEQLNVSAPEAIIEMHRSFVEAGARVLETNTFGANSVVLKEYGLEGAVENLNAAAVANAREAIGERSGIYIAGSVGPGTRLPSLGHISVEELAESYSEQIRVLVEAGVDLLFIETCQDLLQARTVVVAAREVLEQLGSSIPISVSVTLEETGTMLVGSDLPAVVSALEPFDLFSLGLNCATGPEQMASHVQSLSRRWGGRISAIPNAGIPEVVDGETSYRLSPEGFAQHLKRYVEEFGVSIVGGCCGTRPEHIQRLAEALASASPPAREVRAPASLASGYQAVEIHQEIPPLLIGERTNANGSKRFRQCLEADDFDACLRIAIEQETGGAQAIDLCTAYAGRDEQADLTHLTRMFAESVRAPLVIDSTRPDCIAAALPLYPGRCLINSVNLEDGGKTLDAVCTLARKYGAAVVALTIDEQGMAMTAERKLEVARRIHERAVQQHGLRPQDLLFDALTFTVGSGDEKMRPAAKETLEGIRQIREALPGVGTVLGVSNVSFGLPPAARRVLNSVFLHEAVEAGLDAAIVDAAKILPLAKIGAEDRAACLDLIYDRAGDAGDPTPLMRFLEHFAQVPETREEDSDSAGGFRAPEEALSRKVLDGDKDELHDLLAILLRRWPATGIINEILVPAMREVGDLFGRGEMLLPFVLRSAETVRKSVDLLQPHMAQATSDSGLKVLLATVEGDVHDIGKNLVDIILSNNGYRVHNVGIKIPVETIIREAQRIDADVIGLSGLLVKSAMIMQEALPRMKEAGLSAPVLLGGAALTTKFVAESCAPGYDGPVVYCADAFAGLRAIREHEAGRLTSTTYEPAEAAAPEDAGAPTTPAEPIARDNRVPEPSFLGARHVGRIDPAELLPYLNEPALFRARWGFARGNQSEEQYEEMIAEKVRPLYQDLVRRTLHEGLLEPRAAYGYFRCRSQGDAVIVEHEGREHTFAFPRQAGGPGLCIADYFKPAEDGGDVTALFVVSVGGAIDDEIRRLYESNSYHDYLILHGFGAEMTDALAEYWHEVIRRELGIAAVGARSSASHTAVVRHHRGRRYGFGYSACPDLESQAVLFELLRPDAIGVTLTEGMEMVPEHSTSAIVAHHPQARYFAV